MFAASTILYKIIVCLSESRGGSSLGESIFSYCGQRYSSSMQTGGSGTRTSGYFWNTHIARTSHTHQIFLKICFQKYCVIIIN